MMNEKWVVQRYDGLDRVPESCRQLFQRAGQHNVFLSWEWFANFSATVVESEDLVRVYTVRESGLSGEVRGAIVLWLQRRHVSLFAPRVLQGLSNYYTAYFGPLWEGQQDDINEFAETLVRALLEDRNEWDMLDLRPLDLEAPVCRALVKALGEHKVPTQTHCCFGNWYLPIGGRSFEQYVQGLPKVLRKNIPYQTRRLERSFKVEIRLSTGGEDLEVILRDYELVYNSSWRSGEAYPEFVRGLAWSAAREGWLRLCVLYIDGKPIAAQFWIVQKRIGLIYKVCYDEQYAKYSVGTVLTAHMIRHAIDIDRVTEIDFLSGDDGYKKDWMSHRRERWSILAFNRTSGRGVIQAMHHIGGRHVKQQITRARQLVLGWWDSHSANQKTSTGESMITK